MASFRVAQIAPPWRPISPDTASGSELVTHLLAAGLRGRGNEVLVYGCEGSAPGTLCLAPTGWRERRFGSEKGLLESIWAARVFNDLERRGGADVVHLHTAAAPLVTAAYAPSRPVFHTVHGPVTAGTESDLDVYQSLGARVHLVGVSHHQRSLAPWLNWAGVVHNAVDVRSLHSPGTVPKQDYLLYMGRICSSKGPHVAVDVARRANIRLLLAGRIDVRAGGESYFREEIIPHVDGVHIEYLGVVAGKRKADLIAGARALLFTAQWDEPFGLVIAEAMVSGTAVVANRRGAVPEIVSDGETGLIVGDEDDMVGALRRLKEIDTERTAMLARQRFSPATMAAGYAELYAQVGTALEERDQGDRQSCLT
jgi:glycosyltransferase involved in cell wall biosynthesis